MKLEVVFVRNGQEFQRAFLTVGGDNTFTFLTEMIRDEFGITDKLRFLHYGHQIFGHDWPLSNYINGGSLLLHVICIPWKVNIAYGENTSVAVNGSPHDLVSEVKERFLEAVEARNLSLTNLLSVDTLELQYMGQVLEDERTLHSYNILDSNQTLTMPYEEENKKGCLLQ